MPQSDDAPQHASEATSDPPLTVAALSQRIEAALAKGLPASLRVEGEVANAVIRNGHQYFSLREPGASIGCVMWASDLQRCSHTVRDGDRVIAVGSVVHWAPGGRTQLRVRRVEPIGEGALLATFRDRCDQLRARGYFDPSTKKALPAYPRRIAVLTSATGAALHDVMATAKRRFPACALLLVDVPVQGAAAASRVAQALKRVDAAREALHIDAIILTRGGGSLEDLWAFNELVVAEAVHQCTVPVVAAIGHESDVTIVELVADARAATPTGAAAALLPDREEASVRLGLVERSLGRAIRGCLTAATGRLSQRSGVLAHVQRANMHRQSAVIDALQGRLQGAQPAVVLARRGHRLQQLGHRLHVGMRDQLGVAQARVPWAQLPGAIARRVQTVGGQLEVLGRALEIVNPESVLARGFSLTMDNQGKLIRDASALHSGDVLHTRLRHGAVRSRVEPAPTQA